MRRPGRLCLILFDFDGTLIDSQHMIRAAMADAFEAFGVVPPDVQAVRRVVGLPLEAAIEALLPLDAAASVTDLAKAHRDAFRAMLGTPEAMAPMFDGAAELLRGLDGAERLLGICTGRARPSLESMLSHHGLLDHFATLQTADRHPGKPHPSMIDAALDETGVDAENAIMVGDTTFDIEMARNAGVGAIGVAWGYHAAAELRDAGAGGIAQNADDLRLAIEEWTET